MSVRAKVVGGLRDSSSGSIHKKSTPFLSVSSISWTMTVHCQARSWVVADFPVGVIVTPVDPAV